MSRVHEHCDACSFDGATYADADLLESLRILGARWRRQLASAGAHLRSRPAPTTWSAIEYAAHSRDITALHAYGVEQALTGDEPTYPPIGDGVITSAVSSYAEADPDEVCAELTKAAQQLAQLADDAGTTAWTRGLTVGETRSDVRRLLEHALYDSQHHLDDVERGVAAMSH